MSTGALVLRDSSKLPKIQRTPRSPGTHTVGSWVIDGISLYREPRTGNQYICNWASKKLASPKTK